MSVAKVTEITSTSTDSFDDAIKLGSRAPARRYVISKARGWRA